MPLGAGPAGYPDWRRIVDWDGPVVWEILTKAITGEAESGVIDCSRYGYIGGRAFCTPEPLQLRLEWFADQAATKPVGQWLMVISPLVANPAQLRIPNMGPFVRVHLEGKEGTTKSTATVRLYVTNRIHPLQLIPVNSVIVHSALAYAEGESKFVTPTDYYAGPVEVNYESNVGAATAVVVEMEVQPGVLAACPILRFGATVPSAQQKIILPAGAFRLHIANEGAARSINVNLQTSLTGSG
jgi:hypothetical protein